MNSWWFVSHFFRVTSKRDGCEIDFDDTYLDFGDGTSSCRPLDQTKASAGDLARRFTNPEKILKKSVLQPGVEKLHSLPMYDEGRRQMLKKRKVLMQLPWLCAQYSLHSTIYHLHFFADGTWKISWEKLVQYESSWSHRGDEKWPWSVKDEICIRSKAFLQKEWL